MKQKQNLKKKVRLVLEHTNKQPLNNLFKWSKADLNSEFSFSKTDCLIKAKESSLPYYLLRAEERTDEFIPFWRAWVWSETLIIRVVTFVGNEG